MVESVAGLEAGLFGYRGAAFGAPWRVNEKSRGPRTSYVKQWILLINDVMIIFMPSGLLSYSQVDHQVPINSPGSYFQQPRLFASIKR